jgi:hypothetical protein
MRRKAGQLGKSLRSRRLRYSMILIVFAVILVRVLFMGTPHVKELNSQQ